MAQQRKRSQTTRRSADQGASPPRSRKRSGESVPEKRASVRRPSSSGPPVIVIIVGGLVLVGALLYGFMAGAGSSAGAQTYIDAAQRGLTKGDTTGSANKKLLLAEKDPSLTKEHVAQIEALREQFKVIDADILLQASNAVGTKYFQEKLVKYADKHLSGEPGHPEARVFVERSQEFRNRWPSHPEMDWVDRNVGRFASFVDLSKPPTWADMGWKLERLVHGTPKDYAQAFKAMDEFVLTASDTDKMLAKNRRGVMVEERATYFLDRMQQARYELENGNKSESMRLLIYGIIYSGDSALESEAAGYLLKQANVTGVLKGYRQSRPLIWDRLKMNPQVAGYIEDHKSEI
ncbi:MAG: hypothetical protein ACI8Q9_000282 [Planctomycetota bacterium]